MALSLSASLFNPWLSSLKINTAQNQRNSVLLVISGENEPEEKLIGRFRREVLRAGVIQESKRRRFFESTQEKKKRKSRDAARRNRKRRPLPKALLGDTHETLKDEGYKSDEDTWDLIDVESPYT